MDEHRHEHADEGAAESRPEVAPADFWEDKYAGSDQVWSGRVNGTLADVAATLEPGTALDLGCGEGSDVLWLARNGWAATGVDISPTAVARAIKASQAEGVDGSARFVVSDLTDLVETGPYDLVTASFLHSPVALERTEILRRAAELVAVGGHLLVTGHAAAPPWADADAHDHRFLTPDEEVEALDLPPDAWQVVTAEVRRRDAVSPDGEPAQLDDTVVLARRLA